MCESFESVPCRACLQFCSSMFADVYYMPSQTTAEAKVSQVKSSEAMSCQVKSIQEKRQDHPSCLGGIVESQDSI